MKKSTLSKLLDQNLSRDEVRQRLRAYGFENFYQEMEMDSPLVDTHQDISCVSDDVVQHSHLFYEIIFCAQGNIEYLLGVQRFPVQAGDIILIPPGMIHCPILPRKLTVPYKRYVVWISPAFAKMLCDTNSDFWSFQEAVLLHTSGTKWESLQRYFIQGVKEAEIQAPGWQTCLGGNTAQLFVHIARAWQELNTVPVNAKSTLLETILEYIQSNLSRKITVANTAQHFHISQSTLTHLFHQEIGISFYRCVTQRRLVEAKNLIARGIPMGQVCTRVGFQEYSAFYRAFRAAYGISPMQYCQILTHQ